jgi:hypothetical protein
MIETLAEKHARPVAAASRRSRAMKPDTSRHRLPIGSWVTNAHRIQLTIRFRNFREALGAERANFGVKSSPPEVKAS